MPVTGFLCKEGRVKFEDCLAGCAMSLTPPCGHNYAVLASMARDARPPRPITEVTATQVYGCSAKPFLLRTVPDLYTRPEGAYWCLRGNGLHLALARHSMPGAIVERRLDVPLNGNEWRISGQPDVLEPIGVLPDVLYQAGIPVVVPSGTWPYFSGLVHGDPTCTFCTSPASPAFKVSVQGVDAPVATLCANCLARLREAGKVGHRLLDYKSTMSVPQEVREHHRMQVYIYMGLCIKANLPVWEAGMVYLDMRRDKPMPIPVDLDAVRRFWRQVVIPQAKTLLTALATGVCPEPGPQWMSWECEYCDAVDACDYAGQMKKEAAARKRQAVAAAKPKQRGKGRKEARKAA